MHDYLDHQSKLVLITTLLPICAFALYISWLVVPVVVRIVVPAVVEAVVPAVVEAVTQ